MRAWLSAATPIVRRIYSDYLEMPGTRLTLAQAQRLWSLDESTCREALEFLVAAGAISLTRGGTYVLVSDDTVSQRAHRTPKMPLDRLHARHWQGRRHS
jgi:DNA-binding GntR family transcriptional regulator